MFGVFWIGWRQSSCWPHELDVMVLQQISCRVVQLANGNLKTYLRLNEIKLCLSELCLCIEHEKDRLGAQPVFSLIGMKVFPGKVHSDSGGVAEQAKDGIQSHQDGAEAR